MDGQLLITYKTKECIREGRMEWVGWYIQRITCLSPRVDFEKITWKHPSMVYTTLYINENFIKID